MKNCLALLLFIGLFNPVHAQRYINKRQFFTDTSVVQSALKMDVKKIMSSKDIEGRLFPATFSCKMGDSLDVNESITVEVRGHFRRKYCYLPPLKIIYKDDVSSVFYNFRDLKLVSTCIPGRSDDQNLLKEYLIYKIYNLLTDKSFQVRLLNMSYVDGANKRKTVTQHAFLVEHVKELAKRNKCKDMSETKMATRFTDRSQMILTSVFEYMIGNTDWSVPGAHNVKLIRPKTDSTAYPYVVPYDFDFSGLVNTAYSNPDERMGIATVQDRLYRGLSISLDELNPVLDQFKKQKGNIYATINNFGLLSSASKKEMSNYLDGFYATINDKKMVKKEFAAN